MIDNQVLRLLPGDPIACPSGPARLSDVFFHRLFTNEFTTV